MQHDGECIVCHNKTDFISLKDGYKKLCNNRHCITLYTSCFCTKFYTLRGYTEEEAKQFISERQRKNSLKVKRTEEYYDKCFNNRLNFYIKRGFSEVEAKQKLSDRQRLTTLESFIKRYGNERGLLAYNKRIEKCRNTWNNRTQEDRNRINSSRGRTLAQLIDTHGEVEAKRIMSSRTASNSSVSNLEKEIVAELRKTFSNVHTQLRLHTNDCKVRLYDIVIDSMIVEVNGDFWHANPKFYKSTDIVRKGFTAQDIWQHDEEKRILAEHNSYYIVYVWESEYRENKQKVLNTLIRNIYAFKNN